MEQSTPRYDVAPLITVLMPAFNAQDYLEEAIDSVLSQTERDFEFIIVDDGSTDATPDILARYAEQDTRIRILTNEVNASLPASLNRGLDAARGQYIARMDADDVCLPHRLALQRAFLDTHADHAIVSTGFVFTDLSGTVFDTYTDELEYWLADWMHLFRCAFHHPTIMLRRAVLEQHSLRYDVDTDTAEDLDLWHRVLAVGKGHGLPDVCLMYRVHPQSVTSRRSEQMWSTTLRLLTSNLTRRFPEISYEDAHNLVCFVAGRPGFDWKIAPDGARTLNRLVDRFCETNDLKPDARRDIQQVAARWLVLGAARAIRAPAPGAAAHLLASTARYGRSVPHEMVDFMRRKRRAHLTKSTRLSG